MSIHMFDSNQMSMIQTKAADPMQSQSAWVKRRRLEVNQIAAAVPVQPQGQQTPLPAAAKTAIASMGKLVACFELRFDIDMPVIDCHQSFC